MSPVTGGWHTGRTEEGRRGFRGWAPGFPLAAWVAGFPGYSAWATRQLNFRFR